MSNLKAIVSSAIGNQLDASEKVSGLISKHAEVGFGVSSRTLDNANTLENDNTLGM